MVTGTVPRAVLRLMPSRKWTIATFPGLDRPASWLASRAWPTGPLAAPPAGSDLKPIPGDAGPPIIGYALEVVRDSNVLALGKRREHGPVYWGRSFGFTVVSVSGEAASQVLWNKDKAFDSGWDLYIGRFFNRGLLLLPDSGEHPRHRRIMQWAFTRQRLAGYVATMDGLVADRMDAWTAAGIKGQFEFYPAMKQLSLDVATVIFMDGELGESADLLAAFQAAVHGGSAILRFPVPGLSWWKGLRGRAKLETYFRGKLPAKRAADQDDLFSALCHARSETDEQFDDDDVVNHMIFLMMAAHDTTTVTATGAVYHLAKHQDWQERARAECVALGGGPIDIGTLDSLTTLDLVVKETLRLVSAVPTIVRRTIRDTEIDGYHLPKGVVVTVMPGVQHQLEEYWTAPDTFDPDRFSEPRREDKSQRHAYIPFGAGGHRCIGVNFGAYEVKLFLYHLLTRYRVSVPTDYKLKWDKSALWFPLDGLPVTLERRG